MLAVLEAFLIPLIPAALVSAGAVPVLAAPTPFADTGPVDATGVSFRLDGDSAQATFSVPCAGCLGGADDDALSFDFQAYPSQQPCGTANLTLNGEPLAQHWTDTRATGTGSLSLDSHNLDLAFESNCLFNDAAAPPHGSSAGGSDTAQVLTVTVQKVDNRIPLSLSGFTISFNQSPEPHLIRLDLAPVSPAPVHPAEDWRAPQKTPIVSEVDQKVLTRAFKRLETLELRQRKLNQQIQKQKKLIESHLNQDTEPKEETSKCDTLLCQLNHRIVNGVNSIYYSLHRHHHTHPHFHPAAGGHQHPTMLDHAEKPHTAVVPHVERPPPAHILPDARPDGYSTLPDDVEAGPTPPKFRRPHRRHPIIAALHFILVIIGLVALWAFLRRRFSSKRSQTERAASREERRNKRAYKRAARRAAFKNWWKSGWGRRQDAQRRLDYEEKRALVQEGEARLEDAMHDEIRDLRRAHSLVDQLVRAEEGRGTTTRPVLVGHRMPGMASIAGVMMGGEHVPAHMRYPSSVSSDDETLVNTPPTSDGQPLSRTNSLPSYQTDPDTDNDSRYFSDNPPSYRTDDDTDSDSDISDASSNSSRGRRPRVGAEIIVTNGFTQYAPSEYTPSLLSPTDSASIFTPESSIPDVSPRESAETVRTFM